MLVNLYKENPGEVLDSLRYQRFCQKLTTNITHVHPQSLPPTSAAYAARKYVIVFGPTYHTPT